MRSPTAPLAGLVLTLLLTGCGTDPAATALTPTPSASASASALPSVPPLVASPTSTLPAGVDQVVDLVVAGGKVSGASSRTKVKKGSVVRVSVRSDVADEVHLHTYDKRADVAAGGTATLTFTASLAGIFEIELEQRGLVLTKFQVQ